MCVNKRCLSIDEVGDDRSRDRDGRLTRHVVSSRGM